MKLIVAFVLNNALQFIVVNLSRSLFNKLITNIFVINNN